MDSGRAQAWIAGVAAVVAIVAAVLSARQAREAGKQAVQAKRQADAAHGDVDPTFHLEQRRHAGRNDRCVVVCRNFNRHALTIHEVRIQHPADIAMIPDSDTVHEAVAHAIDAVELNRHDLSVLRPATTLTGVAPGRDPSESRFEFLIRGAASISEADRHAVQFYDIKEGRTVDLTYEVEFELLDGRGDLRTTPGRAAIRC